MTFGLNLLYAEEELLKRHLTAAVLSQEFPGEFEASNTPVEAIRSRLERVQETIKMIEGPRDFGGWEDH